MSHYITFFVTNLTALVNQINIKHRHILFHILPTACGTFFAGFINTQFAGANGRW